VADEAKGGQADSRRHAPDLSVAPLREDEGDPVIRDGLAETDGRIAWRIGRRRIEKPGEAGQGGASLNEETAAERGECGLVGASLDLGMVGAGMGTAGSEQAGVPGRFIAQEEEALGVGVEPPDRIDMRREAERGQRIIRRAVRGEGG
jgi:hypothetical protein